MKATGAAILFFLAHFAYCSTSLAQQPDTNTVITLNNTAWKIRNSDIDLSKNYADKALKIASAIHYPRGLSNSLNVLGNYYKVKGHYDSAEAYYKKSLAIREKMRDTLKMAISYRNLIGIDKFRGNYKNAIKTGLWAIQLLNLMKSGAAVAKEKGWLEINLAVIYQRVGELDKAVRFAMDGKKLFNELQDEEGITNASLNLGSIYLTQKRYNKALDEYNFCIKTFSESGNLKELAKAYNNMANARLAMKEPLLAMQEYKKSLDIRQKNGFTEDIKNSIHNIGYAYELLDQADSAIHYYRQALTLSRQSGDVEAQAEAYRSIAAVLYQKKDYKNALANQLHALKLSEKSSFLAAKIITLEEISKTYKAYGNSDSALIYNNEYMDLRDSLEEIIHNSILLSSDLSEKDSALLISQEKNKRQTAIIIGIACVLVLLIIIFIMYYFAVQAKRRESRLKQVIREKELIALDAMLEGQEKERKRLGAELHDTIGSILSATKYTFKAMEHSIEQLLTENKTQYQNINRMLDQAMESVRKISHNMTEGILSEKGLEAVLNDLCKTLEESGNIKFKLIMIGFEQPIGYSVEVNLYRIVQELITNIIKHAQAHLVNIQLIKTSSTINLVIEDDGKGFNQQDPHLKKGIGLNNIDSRVKKLGGNWHIDSGKGRGTTIIIDIPLNEEIL